ncbi:MAG: pitrilysin family protein [Pseudomonadota bacterium]
MTPHPRGWLTLCVGMLLTVSGCAPAADPATGTAQAAKEPAPTLAQAPEPPPTSHGVGLEKAAAMQKARARPEKIFDMPYLQRDLDNGLRVIIVKTDYPDIVSLQIPVQTGSRNEIEPGKSGFAHFFEHMMFRGTEKYPPAEYQQILTNAGADQNAYTTDDYTNYHITFTKGDLEKMLEIEADRFMNLSYTEDQFRTEALAVKGEYLKNFSNPVNKMLERIRDLAYTTHTYKHTTMGFLADIEDMPNQLEYSKVFFSRWYRPEKAAIILVGDLDPDATMDMVEQYWGPWEPGTYTADIPAEPPQEAPKYEHLQWESPTQPWLVMAFHGPRMNPSNRGMQAMDLLSELYFAENSELYQKLVIVDQSVDQFFTYFPDRKDPGLLFIFARLTDAEHGLAVRDAINDTLVQARTELIDKRKLTNTKSRQRYRFTAQMDNSEGIAAVLASYVQFRRDPEIINEVYAQYDTLSPEDLQDFANRVFIDRRRTMLSMSSEESFAGIDEMEPLDARVTAINNAPPVDISVVQMRSTSSPLVDVGFIFKAGAAFDPPGKKGLAMLTAAMLSDGGSKSRSIQEINDALYPMAAGFDSQVDKEIVRLAGTVHKDNLANWFELAGDQLLNPGWREEDFERLKTRLSNAIRTDLVGNNDEELGKEVLYEMIYGPEHPYGTYNLGATDDIAALTLEDVQAFYQQYYVAENVKVGLAGGYPEDFAGTVTKALSGLPSGEAPALELPEPPAVEGYSALIVEKETPAVAVSFGFPIDVKRGDPDWVALWLARSWLGEHRNSSGRLYNRIREDRGMNYGDYAYIEYFPRGMYQFHPDTNLSRQQQIFQVWIRPLRNNNDAHFATRVALHELQALVETGLTQEAFESTRNYLDKFVSLLAKTQSRQLGYMLDSNYYQTPGFTTYVRDGLKSLTLEDVNAAISRHLQIDNIKFVFIAKDAADLKQRLVSDTPSPIEYNTPKPELAEEDATIAARELGLEAGAVAVVPGEAIFK